MKDVETLLIGGGLIFLLSGGLKTVIQGIGEGAGTGVKDVLKGTGAGLGEGTAELFGGVGTGINSLFGNLFKGLDFNPPKELSRGTDYYVINNAEKTSSSVQKTPTETPIQILAKQFPATTKGFVTNVYADIPNVVSQTNMGSPSDIANTFMNSILNYKQYITPANLYQDLGINPPTTSSAIGGETNKAQSPATDSAYKQARDATVEKVISALKVGLPGASSATITELLSKQGISISSNSPASSNISTVPANIEARVSSAGVSSPAVKATPISAAAKAFFK